MTDTPLTTLPLVDIDIDNVDGELRNHTQALCAAGRTLAEKTRAMAYAKLHLQKVESYLKIETKSAAELKGVRMSEKTVDATVYQLDAYQERQAALIEATYARDVARGDLTALESKGRHVDLLGRRDTAEYRAGFTTPSA